MELDTQRDTTTEHGPLKEKITEHAPKKDTTTEQGQLKDKTMAQEPQKDHTSEPEVSVIVPIYNMESCLPACVKSIAEQGACVREIILVDDGSTDGSRTVCEGLARDDARIRVSAKENGGAATARNAGLAVAQGRWISFVDPDDRLVPDAFEQLLSAADAETEIICADFEVVYHDAANGQTVKKSRFFVDEMMASSAEEKCLCTGSFSTRATGSRGKALLRASVFPGRSCTGGISCVNISLLLIRRCEECRITCLTCMLFVPREAFGMFTGPFISTTMGIRTGCSVPSNRPMQIRRRPLSWREEKHCSGRGWRKMRESGGLPLMKH